MCSCIIFVDELKENVKGFFSKILATLGIGDAEASEAPALAAPAPAASASAPAAAVSATPPAPKAIAVVDVVAQLEQRAAANSQKLNWRTSIVDLLKLLEIDSSYVARKELAKELNCPEQNMGDSAKMNMWLHKMVLAQIAANGGNIPADLLD